MKKIFAIIISLALLSTASVTAFAASPITAKDEVTPQWLRVLMLRAMLQQQFTV